MEIEAVVTEAAAADALDTVIADWGATDIMILFTDNITPDRSTVIGDLTQPSETWYTGLTKTITYGAAYRTEDGRVAVRTNQIRFDWTAAGGAGPATIYGAAVATAASAALRAAVRFTTPVTLSDTLSQLAVTLVVSLEQQP